MKTSNPFYAWTQKRIKQEQITKYLVKGKDFIPESEIVTMLQNMPKKVELRRIREIFAKALSIKTLDPEEVVLLLAIQDPEIQQEMQEIALKIKKKVYDNRIVTFAPLYIGNMCVNNCQYCGFRQENAEVKRSVLTMEEIRNETKVLAGTIGHKRVIAVYGEHIRTDIDFIVKSMQEIYAVKEKTRHGWGNIRRVNVNAPSFSIEDLKRLHEVGIGTYQVFQETYHKDTYTRMHPAGTIKGNYLWRLYSMHRAFEAGIDDVGLGVLFGLYDWQFEVMALVYHSHELEKRFGIGPHTISFPRLEPAVNTPLIAQSPYRVSDKDFLRLITVLRLAIPHAGMIVTAREKASIRSEALFLGVTQLDASTRIGVGTYSDSIKEQQADRQQFMLGDTRTLEEVISELIDRGFITSFCTAGYRCGRTGECIMELLRTGQEGKLCKLNAVLTFQEWLDDFASKDTQRKAIPLIHKEMQQIKKEVPMLYDTFKEYYDRTVRGERDLYF